MSSPERKKNDHPEFAVRFIEVCGTSSPAKIHQLLGISEQAARNYLGGRLPDAQILVRIAERTPYSIHWLLTGNGKKFADHASGQGATVLTRQLEESVQRIVEVINELSGRQTAAQAKVVVLQSGEVLSEKVVDKATLLTDKQL